jgi:glycosyltransferase involved in cell wall biosynthesis
MRIGVNILHQASGGSLTSFATWLEDLHHVGGLDRHHWILFCSGNAAARLEKQVSGEVWQRMNVVLFPASDRGLVGRLLDEQFRLPAALKQHAIDVLFCPANTMPYRSRVPAIVMFQNMAPFCETMGITDSGLLPWLRMKLLGQFMRISAKRARRVIFLSRYVRDFFARRFGVDPSRAYVLPHGMVRIDAVPDPELEARLGIRRPFLLCISHLNPYKNLVELIEGFGIAGASGAGRQLVIAGGKYYPKYFTRMEAARQHAGAADILITGELAHEDTLKLLASCEMFVFSSTCESCPNTLLEAQALGTPIASSDAGVMPEMSGDAAVYFDPHDPRDIARALRRLIDEPALRAELRERAVAHAAAWPSGAQIALDTLSAIEECARSIA